MTKLVTVITPGDLDPTDFVVDPDSKQVKLRPVAAVVAVDPTYIANTPISGQSAVMLVAGTFVEPADPSELFVYAGVAANTAQIGMPVQVRRTGTMASDTWSWQPGKPIFVAPAGALTQVPPTMGYSKLIGYALDAQTIYLAPEMTILLGG